MNEHPSVPKINELAEQADLVQPREPLPQPVYQVGEMVARICLEILSCVPPGDTKAARKAVDHFLGKMLDPVVASVAWQAGLVREGEAAPPKILRFAVLVAQRFKELLKLQHERMLPSAGNALKAEFCTGQSKVDYGQWACAVGLANAAHIPEPLRNLAMETYQARMIQHFGDLEAVGQAFLQWENGENLTAWLDAKALSQAAAIAALPKDAAEALRIGEPGGAHFEFHVVRD